MRGQGKWTTEDELLFLNGLGGWSGNSSGKDRRGILIDYWRSLERRADFGSMDVERIKQHCSVLIGRS